MALTSNVTFVGKQSFDFFSAALFDNSILSEFQVYDSQQNTLRIPRVTLAGHIQADSCAFGATGSITLDPLVLNVCSFKINDQICRSEVEPTFLSLNLPAGSNNAVAPADFTNYILNELGGQIGNNMQNVLWNGDVEGGEGILAICDGILVQAGTASSVVQVAATASAITPETVEAELARTFAAVPANVKSSGRPYKIYVSQDIFDAYVIKLSKYGLDSTTAKSPNFAGVPVVVAPYLGTKKMFACDPSNIAVAVDLLSDWSEVKVLDMSDITTENAIRIAARWKFAVGIKMENECVLYS